MAAGVSASPLAKLRKTERFDIVSPVVTAGIIGGLAFPATAPLAGGALATLGAQQFITGTGLAVGAPELTITQRALEASRAGLGLAQVGFGLELEI